MLPEVEGAIVPAPVAPAPGAPDARVTADRAAADLVLAGLPARVVAARVPVARVPAARVPTAQPPARAGRARGDGGEQAQVARAAAVPKAVAGIAKERDRPPGATVADLPVATIEMLSARDAT